MKKMLDKYKIPGYERRTTFYVIERGNNSENHIQLQAELGFIHTKEVTERIGITKPRLKNKVSSEESVQLTLELN